MSPDPRQQKIAKGAIVDIDSNSENIKVNSFLMFQYNPESLTRTISTLPKEEQLQERKNTIENSPLELISFNLEFDSVDKIENRSRSKNKCENSLHPAFAALESIMFSQYDSNNSSSSVIFFLWGPNRIIPVKIDSLKITEEAFDSNLNPIRAKIEVNMRAQNFSELKKQSLGHTIFLNNQNQREELRKIYCESKENSDFYNKVLCNVQQYLVKRKSFARNINKNYQK